MKAALGLTVTLIRAAGVLLAGSLVYDHFREHTTDRSSPAVLKSVQDLKRFDAATGSFEVLVDLRKDGSLPDFISSRHVLFIAVGSVDCYIDFSALTTKTINLTPDHRGVTIVLPPPALAKANLDNTLSHVYNVDNGLLESVSDLFGQDQSLEHQAYIAGEQRIGEAAKVAGLQTRAEDNARIVLSGMLTALGFQTVTVTFDAPG